MDKLAERLRNERLTQGKTLRDLAGTTKIREPYLDAIEKGRYDVLPAVYVRSFIRTIATQLNVPRQEVDTLMDEVFDVQGEQPQRLPSRTVVPEPLEKSSQGFQLPTLNTQGIRKKIASLPRSIVVLTILGVILLAALFAYVQHSSQEKSQEYLTDSSVVEVDGSQAIGEQPTTDSIILRATAKDTAWLNITMDGERSQRLIVVPGEEYRWSSMNSFVLSVGNAGAITLFRNGTQLPALGKSGQAIRAATITRTDVTTSASAFKPPVRPTTPEPTNTGTNSKKMSTAPAPKPKPKSDKKPTVKSNSKPLKKAVVTKSTLKKRQAIGRTLITPVPPRR